MTDRRLSIFNRFKTGKRELTGEAKRQRLIVMTLAERNSPADRTRTGIAQRMAEGGGQLWKNVYSGIFRDLDEILLPMHIVEEEGRLPLKRGPKALQEMGMPYYRLTREGRLVALSLTEPGSSGKKLLDMFFEEAKPEEKRFARILGILAETSPLFVSHVARLYVEAFCEGRIKSLVPFDLAQLRTIRESPFRMQEEIMRAFAGFEKHERDETMSLLEEMSAENRGEDGVGGAEISGNDSE